MTDPILRTQNYYTRIDPQHYYKDSAGVQLNNKSVHATKYRDVYLSDLLNNQTCGITFNLYRDTDNKAAPVKNGGVVKSGIVRSYNPETNLVAIDCVKNRPSRLSVLFKRTNKMRYVEPHAIVVSSISRYCLLRRVPKRASSASPKGRASPKGSASPKASAGRRETFSSGSRGGKRNTRKRRQIRK